MKNIKWVAAAILIIAMSCSSSKITSSWKAQNITPAKFNKILVLGLIHEKDRQMQEKLEQHLVGDLRDIGYTAISAMQEYGPKAFENMDEKAALQKIKNSGVDAVITIVLLDKTKERRYVPGRSYAVSNFWSYYRARYSRIYEPGYFVTDTKYFWESNFYEMNNQTVLYSAQTKSFSPESAETLGHEYGMLVVKDLVKQKVLQQLSVKEE
ncbi:MAG: hypothetical protein IPP48_11205 [Chitinophagaceae bacterium]|nr:hypothetical protein [Chitinophagaceae bacterium]